MKLFLYFFGLAALLLGGAFLNETPTAAKSGAGNLPVKKMLTISNESPIRVTNIYLAVEGDDPDRKKVLWREIDIRDLLASGNGNGQLEQGERIELVNLEEDYYQFKLEGINRNDEAVQAVIRRVQVREDMENDVPLSENQFRPR